MAMIKCVNVKKNYRLGRTIVHALRGVSLSVEKSDFIIIVGPSGSGKCVDPKTRIFLETGQARPIKDLINGCKSSPFKNNSKLFHLNDNIQLLSFNGKRISSEKAIAFYKGKTKNLFEIITRQGKRIKVSGEHPFFSIGSNGLTEIKSSAIKEGTFILTPRKVPSVSKKYNFSFECLQKTKNLRLVDSPKIVQKIKKKIKLSNKEIARKLLVEQGTLATWLTENNIPLYYLNELCLLANESFNKILSKKRLVKSKGAPKGIEIKLPLKSSPELCEWLGFILGDGHVEKAGVRFTNKSIQLINRFDQLTKKVWNLESQTKKRKNHFVASISSAGLTELVNMLLELKTGKKDSTFSVPDFIFQVSNKEVARFIRALFDCDSFVAKDKSEINITSTSRTFIEDLSFLLLKFGIPSKIGFQFKRATNSSMKKKKYYCASISSHKHIALYQSRIGFNCTNKKRRLDATIAKFGSDSNVDIIPISPLFRNIRRKLNISNKRIKKRYGKDFWQLEGTSREPKAETAKLLYGILSKRFKEFSNILENINDYSHSDYPSLCRNIGFKLLRLMKAKEKNLYHRKYVKLVKIHQKEIKEKIKEHLLNQLKDVKPLLKQFQRIISINENCFWDKVVKIKKHEGNFEVIDLTVPSTQNFIANGIVTHNSTLLHLMGALDKPTSGKVYVNGENLSYFDDNQLALLRRKKMGFIFQAFNLIPTLTALENVMIPTEPTGIPFEEAEEKAIKLLKEVGLELRMQHKPDELSGGERQRVAIARALINDPEIIYADEPTGNLDTITGQKIVNLMKKLSRIEKKTFVIVTHDESLLPFATKKFVLRDGLIHSIKKKAVKKYVE